MLWKYWIKYSFEKRSQQVTSKCLSLQWLRKTEVYSRIVLFPHSSCVVLQVLQVLEEPSNTFHLQCSWDLTWQLSWNGHWNNDNLKTDLLAWAQVWKDVSSSMCKPLLRKAPSWSCSEQRPDPGETAGLLSRRWTVWCGGQEQSQADSLPREPCCGPAVEPSERETWTAQDYWSDQESPTIPDIARSRREQN